MKDDVYDALRETIKAIGGFASAGKRLRPELHADAAERWLLDAVNRGRAQKLSPEQFLVIATWGREAGCHALMNYITADTGYEQTKPKVYAEQVNDGWGDVALAKLTIYARTHAQFTSYDFRQAYTGPEPPTPKAFGPAFLKAAKQGVIQRVGYQPHPERHCSPTPVWRSLICAEAA